MVRAFFGWGLFVLAGCAAQPAGRAPPPSEPDPVLEDVFRNPPGTDPDDETAPTPLAAIEIHVLDVWASPVVADRTFSVRRDGAEVSLAGTNPFVLPLYDEARYAVALDASYHDPVSAEIVFDGGEHERSVWVEGADAASTARVAVAHDLEQVDGRDVWVHRVYFGLRHRWFAPSGPPARHDNDVELLVAGEEAWGRVYDDLTAARESILLSTWWWGSTFELVRSEHATLSERRARTILEVLRASPAVKRVIVGQFIDQDGFLTWLNTDAEVRSYGPLGGDRFELMGIANETRGRFWFEIEPFSFVDRVTTRAPNGTSRTFEPSPDVFSDVPPRSVDLTAWPIEIEVQHASHHQKYIVVDGSVAFVGGANLRITDWDGETHQVFDPRRMELDATDAERYAVAAHTRLPDSGPRRDYMVRIEGPAVEDVADVFHETWEHLFTIGADNAAYASHFDVARALPPAASGVDVQITTTSPAPFDDHSIAETWFNAIGRAERYIFIESQYFRIPMLADAIVDRMNEEPDLLLVVVTKPVSEWFDPGCFWTYRTHEELAARFPGRYLLLQLRSFDVVRDDLGIDETRERFTDIDVHSKMLIVDDVFMSVGSANMNNRGLVYEAEMNVAIADEAWVRAVRRRILHNLLGPSFGVSDDPADWYRELESAADWNAAVRAAWELEAGDVDLNGAPLPASLVPRGLFYPLDFPAPAECFLEAIGPDMV